MTVGEATGPDVAELYRLLGGAPGIANVVAAFYARIRRDQAFESLRDMHAGDWAVHEEKLALFLTGWLGGPDDYAARFGHTALPLAHGHLAIGPDERALWLIGMRDAACETGVPLEAANALVRRLSIPAARIEQRCRMNRISD